MESKEAHLVLSRLQKAKDDVKRLEAEYRKVCECNDRISGAKPASEYQKWSYEKIYKTCKYHEVKYYYHDTEPKHHAKI
jgi:hypothetical protein